MPINTRKVEDRTIKSTGTDAQTEEHEVAQRRSGNTGPGGDPEAAETPADKVDDGKQTAGPQHESRENPAAGPTDQSGTKQKQEKQEQPPAESDGKAMSQNGARVTDFEKT